MSRTPPASIRLTSGNLNYDQVAASTYYYQSHLKEGLSLESVVRMLADNVGFLTARQKKKAVPLIVMGLLPIYTQLRAKKWYHRYLSKSVYWFHRKLFRGGYCDSFHYHNSKIYKQRQKQLAPYETKIKKNATPLMEGLQKLTACMPKKSQRDPYNNMTLAQGQYHQKPVFWQKNEKKSGPDYGKFFCLSARFAAHSKKQKNFYQHYRKCFVDSLFAIKKKKANLKPKTKIKSIKPYTGGFTKPGAWQRKNLFAIFCLEQIIGKIHHVESGFRPMPGDSITKSFTNRNKKKFKTFYDVQTIRQLTTECYLKIRKGYNIPRSQIDKLILTHIDPDGRRVSSQHAGRKPPKYSKLSTELIQCFDFNRCVRQFKTNVTPKFWISRQYNAHTKLNLFSVVEGRYSRGGYENFYPFQRDRLMPSYYAGWKRLKSSFVFEFDVFSCNDDKKSLRPTSSLRF